MEDLLPTIALKLSIRKVIMRLSSIITFIVIFLLVMYGLLPSWNTKLITVIILLSIGTLPNTILLIEYLINTIKIDHVEFSTQSLKVYYKNGVTYNYSYENLKLIELYKAAGMDKGNFSFNSNEKFYFAVIKTKDGKNIILTSLLGPDLSDALDRIKNVPVERIKTGYAFIFRST
jgi:hypothetical protein